MIISAGFDAHSADPLANINLVENDFSYITDQLKMIANNYCEGRLLSMLEGGYDINALEQSILTHIKILQTQIMNDKKKTVKDSYGRLIENKSFDEYWDEFHKIENLSMKESIRQKNERKSKIKDK